MADSGHPPARDRSERSGSPDSVPSPGETPPPKAADATRVYNAETADGHDDIPPHFAAEDQWPPLPSQLGKYGIESCIGQGGMGVVWKAHDPDLSRTVAIKVLAPHLAQSRTARQRFKREARAAAAISHPHVLTIHAVDEHDQAPFLVMEYVSGGSLKEYVSERGKLPPVQAIQMSCQIAQGLAAAHAQGVIHRDVKPGNVMLHEGGVRVRLADFGLARAAFDNSELTSHDQAVGTPAYMAPEQLRGERVDARADLFSLGCVMHYMLVGHSPFQGRTQGETIHKILGETPRPLLEIDPTIPPALAEIVDRLLRKNPDERYQSAFEVAAVLERFLTLLNQAPTDEIANILARPGLAQSGNSVGAAGRSLRRNAIVTGIAVAAVAALAVILVIVLRPPAGGGGTPPVGGQGSGVGGTPAPPTRLPRQLMVARDGTAEFRTLHDALEAAQPGDVVRVIDDATYEVSVNLQNRRGLVLEAAAGAHLVAQNPDQHVIQVHGGRDITIRGFRITTTGVDQHAILLMECEGVRLEDLAIRQEGARAVAAINVADCNGSPDAEPMVISGCRVETRSTGQCLWVNADTQPVWNVTITGNHFQGAGTGTLAVLVAPVGAVQLQNNVFDGGHVGLNLELLASRNTQVHPIALQVANNSFCDCRSWIGLMHTEPAATPLTLANNLILDCETVEASDAQQRALVEHGVVGGNVWERPPQESALPQALQRWARVEPTVVVQSRDPADDAFLRLPADSPLKSAGAGGDLPAHVGARP